MPDPEQLPKNQPAEILVGGIPQYVGEISATTAHGLHMTDARPSRGKLSVRSFNIYPGTKAELVFQDLFDDDGAQMIVPITLESADGTTLSVGFSDPVSEVTGLVLKKLRSTSRGRPRPDRQQTSDIMPELRKRAVRQLDKIMNEYLLALADHLFDMSSRPHGSSVQEFCYESMVIIKRSKDAIRKTFSEEFDAFFDDPVKNPEEDEPHEDRTTEEFEELDLVDIQEYEDSLSFNRLIKTGTETYAVPLECLTVRFAELADMDPLDVRLPMHIAQVCQAFRSSIKGRDLADEIHAEVYNFFAERVLRALDPYYTSLNAFLRDMGISPAIEDEVKKHGSILAKLENRRKKATGQDQPWETEQNDKEANAASRSGPAAQQAAPAATKSASAVEADHDDLVEQFANLPKQEFHPDNLYRSVLDALNFQHDPSEPGSGGGSGGGGGAGGGGGGTAAAGQAGALVGTGGSGVAKAAGDAGSESVADSAMLAQALSLLQQDDSARSQLQQTTSLRRYLSDNQASISALHGTSGFAPEGLNQLDLVDNLFNSLRTDVDVTPDLQPSLGNLQIPLAKLALLEPQFFGDPQHPARGVVDKLTQLASSANYPNKALENRVSGIVDHITHNYKTDSSVFKTALGDLEKLALQQQRALERNIERVVKTQDGQQKLSKAKNAVEKILRSRIRAPSAPKPVVDLVNSGWRDLLILTHVKDGPNSAAWKDYVKTLDLLLLWLIEQQKGDLSEELQVEKALEAEPFVDMVRQQITSALPTNVAHEPVLEELEDILAGRAEVEQTPVAPLADEKQLTPAQIRAKVEKLPRLRRWVRRAEELELGTWLNFTTKEGKLRRMQLVWTSDTKDHFIFVNERGQKIADYSNIKVARELSRGTKPPSPAENLPLVDQSMYNTLEHVQKSLSFQNNHDSLTKLINKKTFLEQMERVLKHAKTKHSQHGLLVIDIDQFRLVNEVYDEVTGNVVLTEFAKLLAQKHDPKTSSARLEGNKFAVLLQDRTQEQAIAIAENIRHDIEHSPVTIESDHVSFTVSIGVATIVDHTASVEGALQHAETAVRKAKQDGRNRVVQFHEDQSRAEQYKQEELASIAEIEKTLASGDFVLMVQAIIRASSDTQMGKIKHYEILLSVRDENGELGSPQDFIINAERFGYMVQVDRWVVKQVFTWINQQMDAQKEIPYLSINLSGNSVTDDDFMDYLFEQISEFGVGTNRLCFEITETGTISNMIKAADFVRQFKNIGCKFSIDDFGTGMASHNYLRELPVDYVKIDGTFISNIHQSRRDYAMAKSINDLAHFLGQETIAEFVENDQIIEKLREIGVDYLQGWGIRKPTLLQDLSGNLEMIEK